MEEFLRENSSKLKVDRTRGLAKIAVKHFVFTKIQSALRPYKLIKIE